MRIWPRKSVSDEKIEVVCGEQRVAGCIFDESFGGIGVEFPGPPPIVLGQELIIQRNGEHTPAVVRHLSQSDNGKYRIGLKWKPVGLDYRSDQLQSESSADGVDDFFDELPGGLYIMSRLFEEDRWQDLTAAVTRLSDQARLAGVQPSLMPHIENLKEILAAQTPKRRIGQALLGLIAECRSLTNAHEQASQEIEAAKAREPAAI